MARPSKYPEQFRQDAAEPVRSSGRTLRDVGRELGVNHETLRNWVNAAKRAEQPTAGRGSGEPVSTDEREELRRLRKKVEDLVASSYAGVSPPRAVTPPAPQLIRPQTSSNAFVRRDLFGTDSNNNLFDFDIMVARWGIQL